MVQFQNFQKRIQAINFFQIALPNMWLLVLIEWNLAKLI